MSATEFRIYLNKECTVWAVVDEEDYHYFSRWKWHHNRVNPRKKKRHGSKGYARRCPGSGGNYRPPLYLHKEIMKRVEPPPSLFHTIVDHEDGDELNCRRYNLRWATSKDNAQNRKKRGSHGNTQPSTSAPPADAHAIPF